MGALPEEVTGMARVWETPGRDQGKEAKVFTLEGGGFKET